MAEFVVEEEESETTTSDASRMLKEEVVQLRKELAFTQEQLRVLQRAKENVPPPATQDSKWNWISRNKEHELVPQEEQEDVVEMVDTSTMTPPRNNIKKEQDAGGLLHRRHTDPMESTVAGPETADTTDERRRLPFTLKAKLSDIEAQGSPRSSSDNSEESFLSHTNLDLGDDDADCDGLVRTTANNIEDEPFWKSIADRSGWLVGLLILQSCSSFILSSNQGLLQSHIVLVQFLTMLVGAGGNAGNQASVRGMHIYIYS